MSSQQATAVIAVLAVGIAARILLNQIRAARPTSAPRDRPRAEGGGARRDRHRAGPRPRDERDPPPVRGAPAAGVRGRGRRHRGAGRPRTRSCARTRRSAAWWASTREVIEGQPWTALAAAVDGRRRVVRHAAARPARARSSGRGSRSTSSRASSEIPTTPPRRLLLVRDVTAGTRGRPDDPLALPVPAGSRRGPHAASCDGRTPRSRPSATASPATCTTVRCRACRAASLSLEAALLMIKAGETERGLEVLREDPQGARRGGRRAAPADVGPAPAACWRSAG